MESKGKSSVQYPLPWFKFWASRWLGSATVSGMTLAEQGLFLRILCAQHMYGALPRDAWKLSKLLGTRYETTTAWLQKYSALTEDAAQSSSEFVVPKMAKLQVTLKKSTPDRAGEEIREEEISPYSPPAGDEGSGSPECQMCFGEGKVPFFENRDGLSTPVGYRPCECMDVG